MQHEISQSLYSDLGEELSQDWRKCTAHSPPANSRSFHETVDGQVPLALQAPAPKVAQLLQEKKSLKNRISI